MSKVKRTGSFGLPSSI